MLLVTQVSGLCNTCTVATLHELNSSAVQCDSIHRNLRQGRKLLLI